MEGLTLPIENQVIFGQIMGRFIKKGKSNKDYYIKEIKKDMTAFKAAFKNIENKVNIDGLNVEEAAELVIRQCGL